ncbi:4-hydroxybenzoate octaprenyltransferase [Marinibactrum halimedae]|uniref:4-hydroxybenzoate octaprenyltransferase n=2 Tax=Marinibactrum halimedae TaxID=1444977 RepID=A0AA37T709_9GAMM|nr:4-hydroxybenzoate octaprenyltransferase [Marinibactrum halimedae]
MAHSPRSIQQRLSGYILLMRLDKPIGSLLLLWPTLAALWLAADQHPDWGNIIIFTLGVVLMRSAGCVINDYADRKVDGQVERTHQRPLVTGKVSSREAIVLFFSLCLAAFVLVLFTNTITVYWSFGAVALAAMYPFAKRYTHLPQVVLGAAFSWAIPMAFAAQTGSVPSGAWLFFAAHLLWVVAYDTFYAMVDRNDDVHAGIKSTAILFGEQDRVITAALQGLVLIGMVMIGHQFALTWPYFCAIAGISGLFAYQQILIRHRERAACFKAFLNNSWVGLIWFLGVVASRLIG